MIAEETFKKIETEVKDSILELFNFVEQQDFENYILFLLGSECREKVNRVCSTPITSISANYDNYLDQDRVDFIEQFLKTYYSFNNGNWVIYDAYRIHMELMIYCHIWESMPFLKQLLRVRDVAVKRKYPWFINWGDTKSYEIPEMSKHKFINKTKKELKGFKIHCVIGKGFHSSLRNAFAHSDYVLSTMNQKNTIDLLNYKEKDESWAIASVTFNDWSLYFAYSVLLSYWFNKIFQEQRIQVFNKNKGKSIKIKVPNEQHPNSNYIEKTMNF